MKRKKIWGSILAVVSTAAPIAATASCGGSSENSGASFANLKLADLDKDISEERNLEQAANDASITFKVRSEDESLWKAVAEKFNGHHKGQVNISKTSFSSPDLIPIIETATSTGDLEDIVITDMNVLAKSIENGSWFKPINAQSIFDEKNKDIYDVTAANFSGSDAIFKPHLELNSNVNDVAMGMPIGYGGRNLFMNATMFADDSDNKAIASYAPRKEGADPRSSDVLVRQGIEKVADFPRKNGETKIQYIQRYINEAGDASAESSKLNASHPNWLGYGPGNMFQRIFSVGYSYMKDDALAAGVVTMPWKENLANFGLYATSVDGIYDLDHGILNKADFESKFGDPQFAQYLWNSFGAYMFPQGGGYMTSDRVNHASTLGEVEPFRDKQAAFTFNAKWAGRMSNDGWSHIAPTNSWKDPKLTYEDGKGYATNQLVPLSVPYADISVADSISIRKDVPAVKTVVAKRFMKFLASIDDSEKVTFDSGTDKGIEKTIGEAVAYKFISSINNVRDAQIKNVDANLRNFFRMGLKDEAGTPSDKYHGIAGSVWGRTDKAYLNIFSSHLRDNLQTYYGVTDTNGNKWTFDQFNEKIKKTIEEYNDQMSIL